LEIDYGPLAGLIGSWRGDRGLDIAPEPDGPEENPYYETLDFTPIGDVTNYEQQTLVGLRYQQVVSRKSNDKVFHDQTGYWLWDADTGTVMHSLAIPRGVCLIAGGRFEAGDPVVLEVAAGEASPDWPIAESPLMRKNARTLSFLYKAKLEADRLHYAETTVLDIYGRRFDHTDENELSRI